MYSTSHRIRTDDRVTSTTFTPHHTVRAVSGICVGSSAGRDIVPVCQLCRRSLQLPFCGGGGGGSEADVEWRRGGPPSSSWPGPDAVDPTGPAARARAPGKTRVGGLGGLVCAGTAHPGPRPLGRRNRAARPMKLYFEVTVCCSFVQRRTKLVGGPGPSRVNWARCAGETHNAARPASKQLRRALRAEALNS